MPLCEISRNTTPSRNPPAAKSEGGRTPRKTATGRPARTISPPKRPSKTRNIPAANVVPLARAAKVLLGKRLAKSGRISVLPDMDLSSNAVKKRLDVWNPLGFDEEFMWFLFAMANYEQATSSFCGYRLDFGD